MTGCIPGSVPSPPGTGAPGIPGLRGPPVTPAMVGATPAEGPEPGVAWPRHSRSPGPPLEGSWGAAARGGGRQPHATSPLPCASAPRNTGDFVRAVPARGPEGREPPTPRQGPHEEAEGAEASEPGPAGPTRRRTAGAGPAPVGRSRTTRRPRPKSPAPAPAVP